MTDYLLSLASFALAYYGAWCLLTKLAGVIGRRTQKRRLVPPPVLPVENVYQRGWDDDCRALALSMLLSSRREILFGIEARA